MYPIPKLMSTDRSSEAEGDSGTGELIVLSLEGELQLVTVAIDDVLAELVCIEVVESIEEIIREKAGVILIGKRHRTGVL